MDKIEKKDRANLLDKHLTGIGLPTYGRSTIIRKDMKASPATVQGWLAGTLPSDLMTTLNFCDKYGICPWYWATGVIQYELKDRHSYKSISKYIRNFEQENNACLNDDQYDEIFDLMYRNFDDGKLFITRLKSFLKK
ncbi:MAG: hypothetical protein CMC89_05085 [Flavobacteriaceae bacterium]|nr:hypothetical protein [Flavobacteriaceae bacterium]|tara:strand:+ start:476 stop:886 length:411 start_codon:yes stop_codon:yes gene_type:complete